MAAPAKGTPRKTDVPQPVATNAPAPQRPGPRIAAPIWLALLIAAALGGFYVGNVVMRDPISFGELGGLTAVTEDQLDAVVGTYTIGETTYEVTARDALTQMSSLDAVKNSDGSYAAPSAEGVLAAVRTAIVMREVESRGISVSDDDMVAYAQETFGTDDLASLAASYSMDEDTLRARLKESCAMAKLRAEVVTDAGAAPELPAEPEDGDWGTVTQEYAAYIIALAGDEWDGSLGTWASGEGPYATALHDYDVSEGGASYEAANTAYNVAYQLYGAKVNSANTQWTDFVNGLLCQAQLALSSVVS